ncbi:sulfite reductase flavoprotein alpha-component [Salinisphaera shabanensis E1L3A]|uniref:Sulfite reductase flavoprotein alpha-component n=1 Tax=Salinisphaera shabanensis E1L3A TaxID=1033802 RepID=U2ELZ3_9GAMM|nr:sulfite reductase flavoprotein subunit alpha [Salinisphaera shabanensis]ERJ19207.1 sulfite reductase flavoprotein alpha-component [Salinisphaera shabanensis E1L3A]
MSTIDRFRAIDPIFQLHWFIGITAGIVLMLIGITGGLMSFQEDILEWINADQVAHFENDQRLSPPALIARYEAEHPGHAVSSLFWRQDRPYPVFLGYRTPETTGRRGERAMLDPTTAEPIGMLRGQWTFGLIRQLHQRLAAGATGKFIVGISTIALVLLSITGLWIRWKRRPRQGWRWVWPRALGGKLAGEWHAVLGLWALLAYLIASLTGLWWSFDWYRDGAKALFESETPAHVELAQDTAGVDMDRIWASIAPRLGDAKSVFIRLPGEARDPVEVHYVPANAFHRYADDELFVHPSSGEILGEARFADEATGNQLLTSLYALHMGAFFGTPGVIVMMLASFAMPVFFVTGLLLYLRRRRMKRQVAATPSVHADAPPGADTLLVAYASQSGLAQRIAGQTAAALQSAGRAVRMSGLNEIQPASLRDHRQALFVVSTHGDGDAPVAARAFDRRFCSATTPRLEELDYALLSLGDTDYADSYCAFGRRFDRALRERGARTLIAPIEVDKADATALADWHAALAGLFGTTNADVEPVFDRWRLAARRILNPDSLGGPTACLRLEPIEASATHWQAGDIVEIRPRQPQATVEAWLQQHGIDGETPVVHADRAQPLRSALADRHLPDDVAGVPADVQTWFDGLAPLAARDYSIANIGNGAIELLVRLARHEYGTGLASGWLIERAEIGDTVELRLRANPGFRGDAKTQRSPAIFIGNGTGMAGLRSHLLERMDKGQHANWLLFGERQRAVDFYYGERLTARHHSGEIAHLDTAFSRDADDGRYVQHALAEHADRLRDWIANGAFVFVCGSHDGMAAGVTQTLTEILGAETVEQLNEAGRIRMDVY